MVARPNEKAPLGLTQRVHLGLRGVDALAPHSLEARAIQSSLSSQSTEKPIKPRLQACASRQKVSLNEAWWSHHAERGRKVPRGGESR